MKTETNFRNDGAGFQQTFTEMYERFSTELDEMEVTGLTLVRELDMYLSLVQKHLGLIKEQLVSFPKLTSGQEIWFFKYLKPKLYAEKIFRFQVYMVQSNKPVGTPETVRAYLEEELRLLQRFFARYAFLFQYYKLDASELDNNYFIRGAEVPVILLPEMVESDESFSTSAGYLFAKFIAYERLQQYLLQEMVQPGFPLLYDQGERKKKRPPLRWTGDAINIVELGFSLFDTGQLNDGHATLTEIFEWMEHQLHISIGKPHKRLEEIDARKRMSKTHFLDLAKNALLNRLERRNEFDPEKEEARRARSEKRRKAAEKNAQVIPGVAAQENSALRDE